MSEVVVYFSENMQISTDNMEDNTENVETSTKVTDSGGTLDSDTLVSIDGKLSVIMFLLLFIFCWQCMRHWRNNVLKGVK